MQGSEEESPPKRTQTQDLASEEEELEDSDDLSDVEELPVRFTTCFKYCSGLKPLLCAVVGELFRWIS